MIHIQAKDTHIQITQYHIASRSNEVNCNVHETLTFNDQMEIIHKLHNIYSHLNNTVL